MGMEQTRIDGLRVWVGQRDRVVTVSQMRESGYGWEDAAVAIAKLGQRVVAKEVRSLWFPRPS